MKDINKQKNNYGKRKKMEKLDLSNRILINAILSLFLALFIIQLVSAVSLTLISLIFIRQASEMFRNCRHLVNINIA